MKELYDILTKDLFSDEFTTRERFIYGIIVPLAFVAVAMLAGAIG